MAGIQTAVDILILPLQPDDLACQLVPALADLPDLILQLAVFAFQIAIGFPDLFLFILGPGNAHADRILTQIALLLPGF